MQSRYTSPFLFEHSFANAHHIRQFKEYLLDITSILRTFIKLNKMTTRIPNQESRIFHIYDILKSANVSMQNVDECKLLIDKEENIISDYVKEVQDYADLVWTNIDTLRTRVAVLTKIFNTRKPTNINQLMKMLTNEAQVKSLEKLLHTNECDHVYLEQYETNTLTDKKHINIQGTFSLLGAMNAKGTRDNHNVKMYKDRTFWCSCPDHKFNSVKKKMYCKHICFIVCKVGKILDPSFFETKILTPEQFDSLIAKAQDTTKLICDTTICRPPAEITSSYFKGTTKEITDDDVCPICFDALQSPSSSNNNPLLSCPSCKNYVHKECMSVWLERKDTCVYCRSDVWKALLF